MRLADLRALAERFAADHLTEHVAELRHSRRNPGRKEINDPLWGTIGLSGAECAVIDSPLVQRLRLVRQLGVVHWVYPGAVHTRFEHTLGVLRQVQHLSTAINALGVQQGQGEIIDRSRVHLLRLAAILHDVGHGAFSHVSEHALSALPDFEPIASEFALSQKTERRSLSEIFAYYAVLSPAMRELIEVLLDNDGQYIVLDQRREANVDAIQEKLGRLIIGQSVDHDVPLLHELISGPFDADKLDYFVRDAKAAGTPSLLDISRLIQKLAVRSLTSDNLPPAIARSVDRRDRHTLVGMKWSGISVLDELHLSRVLLYAKIYRHPKVMAIEEMVAGALTLLAGASGAERVLELVYRRNDDELLSMTHEAFESALLDAEPKPEESARIAGAARILKRLRLRKLFMKAFQLQRTYPGDPLAQVEDQKYGLIEFREEIEKPSGRERFRQLLVAEVSKIHGMLGNVSRTQVELDGAIRIRALGPTPGGAQIGRAWLLPSAGKPIEFRDYMVNRTIWADSYLSDQPAGYVFCESELTDAVYIATERLLRDRYSVLLPDAALESSKRDADAIQDMKRRLKTAGYYQDAPFDVRPVPRIMARASVGASISTFIPKLTRYQAPDITEDPARTSHAAATASWLRQFDDDEDIDCASVLLDHLRILDRSDTTTAVRRFLETHPEFEGATIVPFGSARDSSAIQSYFAGDLRGKGIAECKTLDEAIRSGSSTRIIFLDDFVGSGGQSSDVLAAGFGRKDLRRDLGEDRDLFSTDIQTFLRSAPLAFVFTAAWDSGLEEVRRITAELGLDTKVFGYLGEDEIPFAPAILNEARPDHAAAFLERSKLLGTRLLDSTAKQKPDESAEARAERLAERGLGYGNRGMLLASPFNVPTQTFTPLWASGTLNGVEWRALMQRRQK